MDPDANLQEQRELAKTIQARQDKWDDTFGRTQKEHTEIIAQQAEDGERLAELVLALDGWISNGGFLLKAWRR